MHRPLGAFAYDAGRGVVFVTDRDKLQVDVVDPTTKMILSAAPADSSPDYVRYVDLTGELCITEPDKEQIEIFNLSQDKTAAPVPSAFIVVKGGPESLVIDGTRDGQLLLIKDPFQAIATLMPTPDR